MRKEKSCGFAPVLPFVRWQSFISSRIFILYFFLCGRLLFSFFVLSRKLGELSFSFATRRRRWHTHIHTKSLEGFISFPCVARHGRTITQSVASDGTRQKPVGLNATYSLFFVVCTKGFAALFGCCCCCCVAGPIQTETYDSLSAFLSLISPRLFSVLLFFLSLS